MFPRPAEQPRQKIPKDGWGPRGVPDCYYVSRTLNSTFRYVKFVKKLRAEEEEQKTGAERELKLLKDKQNSDFFIRCDRRSLINNVARRVELCMASYEEDLKQKRQRLKDLLSHEEEENIRKFVEQAQAGAEAVWQEKKERLAYLLEKRKKEHEQKYKDTPLSKSAHVLPCIHKLRAKEAEEIQLYQIKEKEARKMAEIEFDKMWHAVAMKESDALAARIEQDTIERLRRDLECKQYTDYQLEQRRQQREKERELLRQEALRFKSIWEEDNRKEEEAEAQRLAKRLQNAKDRDDMIKEKVELLRQRAEADKNVGDTWDKLLKGALAGETADEAERRQRERDLDECNRKMIDLRDQLALLENDELIQQEGQRQQEIMDKKRCEYMLWSQKTNRDVRKAMIDQIKERKEAKEQLKKRLQEEDEYHRQLFEQLQALVKHKELTDWQTRKKHQADLVHQIEYNKLLKDRARQDELEEIKKCQQASQQYQEEINKMLCRPFFSDEQHPFVRQMTRDLRMKDKCPCSKPDYCKS